MSFFQRIKDAAISTVPYLMNTAYLIGGLIFAPQARQMFDAAVDYYSGYSINPNTAVYTLAREVVGYFGTPIMLKVGVEFAQKSANFFINKASDLINDYRARANERAQEQPEDAQPNFEEDPKFTQHPDYALMMRFKKVLDANVELQKIVTDPTTQKPDIRKITNLFYSFKPGNNMDRLEHMNAATQAAAFRAFTQRM